MNEFLKSKNIRLRCKKSYPGAHTHIIIGYVLEESERYVVVKGRTFHFTRIVDGMRNQVHTGIETIRIIPWENIEIIHWLSYEVNYNTEFGFDKNGNLILKDDKSTVIAECRDGLE